MGRIHTLRGTVAGDFATPVDPHLIFDYASVDQTRAWKVIDMCFVQTTSMTTSSERSAQQVHTFQLATDTGFDQERLDASENRTFGWEVITTSNGDNPVPIISCVTYKLRCLDPDHLITDQLYLSYHPKTVPNENSVVYEWSYMIRLEAQKISTSESILQAIKGKGQDI